MRNVWKTHAVGKRIVAICLLIVMLFHTSTANAMSLSGENLVEEVKVDETVPENDSELLLETLETETMETETIETSEVVEIVEEIRTVGAGDEMEAEPIEETEAAGFRDVAITIEDFQIKLSGEFYCNEVTSYQIFLEFYDEEDDAFYTDRYELAIGYSNGNVSLNLSEIVVEKEPVYDADYMKLFAYTGDGYYSEPCELVYTAPAVGAFKDASAIFDGFNVRFDGTFNSSYDNATVYFVVEGYDVADTLVYSGRYYDSNTGTVALEDLRTSDGIVGFELINGISYVRLKAVSCSAKYADVYSDKFMRLREPNFTLNVKEIETYSTGINILFGYEGEWLSKPAGTSWDEEISGELRYGTSEDKSIWETKGIGGWRLDTDEKEPIDLKISGLEPETTYYGELYLYKEVFNELIESDVVAGEWVRIYEQTIPLEVFTTTANHTYDLTEVFPDEQLRAVVMECLGITETSGVTSEQLEKVTYLHYSRDDIAKEPIRDLKGIELLTTLSTLSVPYNEISDISNVDWAMLKSLDSLNLRGNNLTALPDSIKDSNLTSIYLSENKLSDTALADSIAKLPKGCTFADYAVTTQRVNDVDLVLEDTYYIYGEKVPVVADILGMKCYTAKLFVDGSEVAATMSGNDVKIDESGIATTGSHTIQAKLYNGEEMVAESPVYTFQVVDEPMFFETEKVYMNSNERYLSVYVYTDEQKTISSANLVDDAGKVYMTTTSAPSTYNTSNDPRFEKVNVYLPGNYLYRTYIYLRSQEYTTIPVGTYDVAVTYADGTTGIFEDIVEIVGETDAVLTGISQTELFDVDEYVYVTLSGTYLNPENCNYSLKQEFVELPLIYIGYKHKSASQAIVKLKKDGWTNFPSNENAEMTVSPKEGYRLYGDLSPETFSDLNRNRSYRVEYFHQYNFALGKLEVAMNPEYWYMPIKVEVRENYNTSYPVIASGTGTATSELSYFELYNTDGTVFRPSGKSYWYTISVGSESSTSSTSTTTTYNFTNRNVWSNLVSVGEGNGVVNGFYLTDIPYSSNDSTAADYEAVITSEEGTALVYAENITIQDTNGYLRIRMPFDLSSLEAGTYPVTLYKGGEVYTSTTLQVVPNDKFILNSVSTSWISDSEMRVYLYTTNTLETDEYTVTLTDAEGNEVEGLTTTVATRNYTNLSLIVSGLDYKDALQKYYVKVTHNTLGEPCRANGNPYYSDERGEEKSNTNPTIGYTSAIDCRTQMVIFNTGVVSFPASIRIYKPYDMQPLKEIIINDASELDSNGYYYFSKSLVESLPNIDASYDVVITDSKNRVNVSGVPLPLTYRTSTAEVPELKFYGASLTLEDSLTVNYKVNKSLIEANGFEKPYVKFTLNGKETIVTDYEVVGTHYVFDFSDIAPNQMNDTIEAVLCAEYDGKEYTSEIVSYSVSEYCYNMLEKCAKDEDATLRTLLVDLLNYGAESQVYTSYKTDHLVNAALTETQKAWGTFVNPELESATNTAYAEIANPTVLWKGVSLNLKDSVAMRFRIGTDSVENLSVHIVSETGKEWNISGDTFAKAENGYYIFFDGLDASQMREGVYLTVYEGETAVSNTLSYSIESYACAKKESGDANLVALVYAMMKYGDAANAYESAQ